MSDVRLALAQLRFTNKAFWRNPAAAFFTFVFPLLFLVIFTVLLGDGRTKAAGGRTVSTATFYIPAIATFSVITACYTNLAMSLTLARDTGVLKRLRGTPLPAWAYMCGRIFHAALVALLLVGICAGFGAVMYGAGLPVDRLPAFFLTLATGAAAFAALGIATTVIVPNADAAPAIVNFIVLPLLFISNVFIPMTRPPAWLEWTSNIFPVRHFADAMYASYLELPGRAALQWADLGIVAAWGALGLVVALRYFSWEPRVP
ncbi:MAG TPA: ABC transporter permease [Actinomycetota bacterium]|jgi:ABC-2 type transport system permease protein|nr:ABC transporter permease [Actinomycetota bacterium]